jgi:hypothetical protein
VTAINSLADLRPGDLLFGPIGGPVGLGVGLGQLALAEGFRVGNLSVRHVGIVTQASGIEYSPGYGEGKLTAPRLAQAMPGGAEIIEMRQQTHWTDRHAYVRLPEDYPGQGEDAAAIARLMVAEGVAYSFASYAALAAWRWGVKTPRLEKWMARRRPGVLVRLPSGKGFDTDGQREGQVTRLPVEAICSVFADQAWSLAGARVMHGVPHQVVTPGAMARQLLWREGAIWGGPGLL